MLSTSIYLPLTSKSKSKAFIHIVLRQISKRRNVFVHGVIIDNFGSCEVGNGVVARNKGMEVEERQIQRLCFTGGEYW